MSAAAPIPADWRMLGPRFLRQRVDEVAHTVVLRVHHGR